MTDQKFGNHDEGKKQDPAARRMDRLPIPKTDLQHCQEKAASTPLEPQCLKCTYFNSLVEEHRHRPDIIHDLPLLKLISVLPRQMTEKLHDFIHEQFSGPEDVSFPCSLADINRDDTLLAALGARLTLVKKLTDLIVDTPVILIDERQQLFFYRDIPIPLRPITFSLLLLLAKTPAEFVERDKIYNHLWPGQENYEGTNKPYERQISDHKRKLTSEIIKGITSKVAVAAEEVKALIITRQKLGYMLNLAKESVLVIKKRDIVAIAFLFLLKWGEFFSNFILEVPEVLS